jgi:hypothetical protein
MRAAACADLIMQVDAADADDLTVRDQRGRRKQEEASEGSLVVESEGGEYPREHFHDAHDEQIDRLGAIRTATAGSLPTINAGKFTCDASNSRGT